MSTNIKTDAPWMELVDDEITAESVGSPLFIFIERVAYQLWGFEWKSIYGEVNFWIEMVDDVPTLRMQSYVLDSDDPDCDHVKPLTTFGPIEQYAGTDPQQAIRDFIHWYVCHEADEQMEFRGERVFYPHDEQGRTINR